MNILIICHEYPRPDIAASNRRLVDILQLITRSHRVALFCPAEARTLVAPRYETLYTAMGIEVHFGSRKELKSQLLRRLYDVCLFEWWVTVPLALEEVCLQQPWATIIVDAVDVCFRREEAALALGHLDAVAVAENRRREIESYLKADALLAVSSEDRATLEQCSPGVPIFFIPMIEATRARSKRQRDREILFVGTFGINAANVDAVLWFVQEVWPSVREAVPDAKLTLVGSNITPEIQRLANGPGIHVAGFVAELSPYLDRAAVSIAPLRFGGGMKGKVTEAMAHGIPVVTTRFGVQGLEATSGEHLIVADDAEAFARGVIELLKDEERAETMGRAGQSFIARLCSPEVVANEVQGLMEMAATRSSLSPRQWLTWSTRSGIDRTLCSIQRAKQSTKILGKKLLPSFLYNHLKKIKQSVRP